MKKILIITDNEFLLKEFKNLIEKRKEELSKFYFDFKFSFRNKAFLSKYKDSIDFKAINVNEDCDSIIKDYQMVFSLHCKQIFPAKLINSVKCINVHPGLNPYNRGWFPQVFSILNKLPAGATIHEIDEELDHGPVIAQKQVEILPYDTSLTAYNKIIKAEIELLDDFLLSILSEKYSTTKKEGGNLNLKADFNNLCKLDLNNTNTLSVHLDLLRALTHGDYANAYYTLDNGKKVFVKIEFKVE